MRDNTTVDKANMKSSQKWLWIAIGSLLIATLAMFIASYEFYAPHYYPFSSHTDQQIGQALLYGGILLSISLFTWVWPIAGGVMATLYSVIKLIQGFSPEPLTLVPVPVYVLLYGLFLAGGIANMTLGLMREKPEGTREFAIKQTRWIARITACAPIVLTPIVYTLMYPSWFAFGAIPGLITVGIAWLWPAPGGFLMLLLTIPGFYNLFESNYDFQMKLPAYILCLIFVASGFLHLFIAWRERRLRAG